ncbi:MAG TPA: ribonuclease Z [Lentimicrobium sp.]|nr:ribonuclease Z [Lentimicrobium sp.]
MKEFSVTILGSSAAIATSNRNLSSQLINHCNRLFLIDCGEGTQFRLRELKIRSNRLKHIFISHLHGDHFFGLIGLISTMHLLRRTEELTVYGPPMLKELIELQLDASETRLYYPLHFVITQDEREEIIYDDGKITVSSFPLQHRIPTTGFIFREVEQPRHINKNTCDHYEIPIIYYDSLRRGRDFVAEDGEIIPNSALTTSPDYPRSFAYCSDTVYTEKTSDYIQGCDVLYHESTFMHNLADAAAEKMHSTNVQAAIIAKKASAKKLILGHFSARYEDLEPMLNEAREVFPETIIAEEGSTIQI